MVLPFTSLTGSAPVWKHQPVPSHDLLLKSDKFRNGDQFSKSGMFRNADMFRNANILEQATRFGTNRHCETCSSLRKYSPFSSEVVDATDFPARGRDLIDGGVHMDGDPQLGSSVLLQINLVWRQSFH
jgi:hypothetical protein